MKPLPSRDTANAKLLRARSQGRQPAAPFDDPAPPRSQGNQETAREPDGQSDTELGCQLRGRRVTPYRGHPRECKPSEPVPGVASGALPTAGTSLGVRSMIDVTGVIGGYPVAAGRLGGVKRI